MSSISRPVNKRHHLYLIWEQPFIMSLLLWGGNVPQPVCHGNSGDQWRVLIALPLTFIESLFFFLSIISGFSFKTNEHETM